MNDQDRREQEWEARAHERAPARRLRRRLRLRSPAGVPAVDARGIIGCRLQQAGTNRHLAGSCSSVHACIGKTGD